MFMWTGWFFFGIKFDIYSFIRKAFIVKYFSDYFIGVS